MTNSSTGFEEVTLGMFVDRCIRLFVSASGLPTDHSAMKIRQNLFAVQGQWLALRLFLHRNSRVPESL
jgi:hypothetical protein